MAVTVTALPITALYAGVLGVAFALSSLAVGLTRAATKKYYGAEHNTVLEFRNRAAGTIGEFGGFGLVLLALLEYNGALSPFLLRWWGLVFVVTRLFHATQLALPRTLPLGLRSFSFLITVALLVIASLRLFVYGLSHS